MADRRGPARATVAAPDAKPRVHEAPGAALYAGRRLDFTCVPRTEVGVAFANAAARAARVHFTSIVTFVMLIFSLVAPPCEPLASMAFSTSMPLATSP